MVKKTPIYLVLTFLHNVLLSSKIKEIKIFEKIILPLKEVYNYLF